MKQARSPDLNASVDGAAATYTQEYVPAEPVEKGYTDKRDRSAVLLEIVSTFHRLLARAGIRLLKPALEETINRHRLWTPLVIGPPERIRIHPTASVGDAVLNSSSGAITIGEHAFFGQHVVIAAGTHDTTLRGERRYVELPRSGHDVVIGAGAWIASGAIVIGPCVIGEHAVVGAGAVVTHDVPAHTVVAGVPARFVRDL